MSKQATNEIESASTGDAFTRDDDGYLYFQDRLKDCIRRRGEEVLVFVVCQPGQSTTRGVRADALSAPLWSRFC